MSKKKDQTGFALITVMGLLIFLAALLYGIAILTSVVQSDVAKKNDILLARNYANSAIFDASNGAVAQILSFESYTFGASYGSTKLESMTVANRLVLRSTYFTNSCGNNGQSVPSGFSKGLCFPESATANSNSLPLLRVASTVNKPCNSSSLTTVIAGQTALPLIDESASTYSFVYATGDTTVCHQPNYTIELLNTEFQINSFVNRARLYRVTVRAYGRNGNTQATEQAYFYVRCPNGACQVSLLNAQIIR